MLLAAKYDVETKALLESFTFDDIDEYEGVNKFFKEIICPFIETNRFNEIPNTFVWRSKYFDMIEVSKYDKNKQAEVLNRITNNQSALLVFWGVYGFNITTKQLDLTINTINRRHSLRNHNIVYAKNFMNLRDYDKFEIDYGSAMHLIRLITNHPKWQGCKLEDLQDTDINKYIFTNESFDFYSDYLPKEESDVDSDESYYNANTDIVPAEDVYLMFIEWLHGRKDKIHNENITKALKNIKEHFIVKDDNTYGRKFDFTEDAYSKISDFILENLTDVDIQYLIEFIDICKINYFPYTTDFTVHINPTQKNGKLYFPKSLKRLNIQFNDLHTFDNSKLEVHMNEDMIHNSSICYIGHEGFGSINKSANGQTYGNITFFID